MADPEHRAARATRAGLAGPAPDPPQRGVADLEPARPCPPPESFSYELRVRYGECDPQGIVFNANYLLYFDVAFTELWRAAVGPWQEMVERGVDAVVAETNLKFLAPARYDDVIVLAATVARLGPTSITTEIDVLRDGETLVQGWLRHVCVATDTWRKTEIPDWVREGLRPYAREVVEAGAT